MTGRADRLQEAGTDKPIPALELIEWAERYGVTAGITTRDGGFNLGLLTPEPAADVLTRWRTFAAAMAPGFRTIAVGLQVHGRTVAIHDGPGPGWIIREDVDGHATKDAGILCCVSVADCVPVYLAHPPSGVVALLHAGWRGVTAGVLDAGLDALRILGVERLDDVVMHCGVAICGECYEVGPEVLAAVTGAAATTTGRLDLRAILAQQASDAGVGVVSVSPWCAAHDTHRFFSHRRSGGADGRMLAYLGRPVA
jgi:YfiH family protein